MSAAEVSALERAISILQARDESPVAIAELSHLIEYWKA